MNASAVECEKNPGHEQFIPPSSFDPPHLPYRCRSLMVWSLILHKARLTVKLIVNSVSPNRPAAFRREYSVRGKGSGYVTDIDRSDPDCVKITIDTAAHVVFNEEEAASTVAKFYFQRKQELFQLKHPRLLVVNCRKDACRIMYTIDEETIQRLIPDSDLAALEYALSPSVLPDVNYHVNISLLQTVIARYQTRSFPLLSFLFREIKCLKNIKFLSNKTRVLEIEINFSLILLYDIILLIIALKSYRDDIMNRMEDIVTNNNVGWDDIHMDTDQGPFIKLLKEKQHNDGHITKSTRNLSLNQFIEIDNEPKSIVHTDFRIRHNEALHTLMNCFITSPVRIAELNLALTDFCRFDISARFNTSGHIVLEITVTSVRVPGKMSLEVSLNYAKVEENDSYIAVLISHPHDMPQQITFGKLERLESRRIEYTTPSCPGSSGGPMWVIPEQITSLEYIEDIDVFTHSYVSGTTEMGVGHSL